MPEMYKVQGFDGVIMITTKRAAAAQKAADEAAKEGLKAGVSGVEAARKGLEYARKYMDSDAWKQAQKALDKAQKELEEARRKTGSHTSVEIGTVGNTANKSKDDWNISTGAGVARVDHKVHEPEGSVSVYKGRVTIKGGLPDDALIYINGKQASKQEAAQLREGQIKRMEVYKGNEAVKRYGEKGRNGVVEIRARR